MDAQITELPNGNIGIGTTTPNAKLEVIDEIRLRLAITNIDKNIARIMPLGYSGITGAMNWSIRGTYQYWNGIGNNSVGGDLDLIKSWNGNTVLTTKTDGSSLGNLGIGTISPISKLDVEGGDFYLGEEVSANGERRQIRVYGYDSNTN